MDLIVDLIDQLIAERIKIALGDPKWGGKDETEARILKEKLRRVLDENIPNK